MELKKKLEFTVEFPDEKELESTIPDNIITMPTYKNEKGDVIMVIVSSGESEVPNNKAMERAAAELYNWLYTSIPGPIFNNLGNFFEDNRKGRTGKRTL